MLEELRWPTPPIVSAEEFAQGRPRRFGVNNPEPMRIPFWERMVRSAASPRTVAEEQSHDPFGQGPVWCFQRDGMSSTLYGDHWTICIGGQHEISCDPNWTIYNEVIVWNPNGELGIFGYPKDVFPPTCFHSATLLEDQIVIIGGLGYPEDLEYWRTPVHILDLKHLSIREVETTGNGPGWIFGHEARLASLQDRWFNPLSKLIGISGGEIIDESGKIVPNSDEYWLDVETMRWTEV